jgi:regulator of sirC expression with transglutaminase-like and TPR domain
MAPGVEGDVAERLWANQGLALAQMERPEHALAAFDHVGETLSDDPRVRYSRGVARLAAGDHQGGRADLEAVVGALPEGDTLRQLARDHLDGAGAAADQRRVGHQGPTPVGAL